MDRGDFNPSSEETILRLENQLLQAEASLLRARAADLEREADSLRASCDSEIASLKEQVRLLQSRIPADRYEELRKAHEKRKQAELDLKWLLKRLHDSALGFVISRRKGFKILVQRHLNGG
jgi:hypothetical protein